MKTARRLLALTVASAIAMACGSESGAGDGASSGSAGTSGGIGGGNLGDGGGGGAGGDGGPGSSGGNPADCLAPVDMFIMFDRSGSMARESGNGTGDPALDCNVGQTVASKWCRAINALSSYFKSAGSDKQAAAIQFFPLDGHRSAQCNSGDGYSAAARPATGYQSLPSDAFDADLNAAKPDTNTNTSAGTPTEAAIRGLTKFTAENRRPGRVTIGILVTDGDPTNLNGSNCDTSLTALSNILKAHHEATQVRTYVIGMEGATDANLERIAEGGAGPVHATNVPGISNSCGGTAECRHWNVGNGDPAAFGAALAEIQASADGCKEGGGFVNPVK